MAEFDCLAGKPAADCLVECRLQVVESFFATVRLEGRVAYRTGPVMGQGRFGRGVGGGQVASRSIATAALLCSSRRSSMGMRA